MWVLALPEYRERSGRQRCCTGVRRIVLLTAVGSLVLAACSTTTATGSTTLATTTTAPTTASTTGADTAVTTAPGTTPTTAPDGAATSRPRPEGPDAPDFTLALGEGGSFTLSDEHRPVYLLFWAEW